MKDKRITVVSVVFGALVLLGGVTVVLAVYDIVTSFTW